MKVLNLEGTAYEIGKKHGEQARKEVHYSLESYEKLFNYEVGINWEEAIEYAKKYLDYIAYTNVKLLEEMEGIAKGAFVKFEDILVLNTRSEIALTQNKQDGCTSLGVLPPLADSVYLAQNWDWRAAQSKSLIVTKILQNSLPTINMVTEAGIIGKIGMNSEGLGVCLNALRANVKSNKLPIHLGLREILNATTITEAESVVSQKKIASSANFLIAQHQEDNNKAINIEVSPLGEDKKETNNDHVYHTNHFCSQSLTKEIGTENLNTVESSFVRQNRMKELITEAKNQKVVVNKDVIKQWLQDHENAPNSICKHKEEGTSDYTNTITAFAIIMDLTKRDLHIMNGNPCEPKDEINLQL